MFRTTPILSGGLLWKIPWRLSRPQKARQRKRLRMVDQVVAVVDTALRKVIASQASKNPGSSTRPNQASAASTEGNSSLRGLAIAAPIPSKGDSGVKAVERWKAEMPREDQMQPKDKYSFFDRKEKTYRKGVHKLPKWTRVSQRLNPPGF